MPKLMIKRGDRAQIEAASVASSLAAGELYLMTDESRLVVGTAANSYAEAAMRGEGQWFPPIKRLGAPRIAGDMVGAPLGQMAPAGSYVYFVPFAVPRPTLVAALRVSVVVANAGSLFAGIYSNRVGPEGDEPDGLLATTPALDASSAGDKDGYFGQALTLSPGIAYWAAVLAKPDVWTPAIRAIPPGARDVALGRTIGSSELVTMLHVYTGSATLPSVAPGGLINGFGDAPAIYLIEV